MSQRARRRNFCRASTGRSSSRQHERSRTIKVAELRTRVKAFGFMKRYPAKDRKVLDATFVTDWSPERSPRGRCVHTQVKLHENTAHVDGSGCDEPYASSA